MNQTATQPLTTLERATTTRPSTNMHFFSALPPLETATIPTFTELLAEYNATVSKPEVVWNSRSRDELARPFAIYQTNLAEANPQPVRWLWQKRLPLAGITLLDGDHGCGKSLLALQIAACVSSGLCLPDGTSTIQGGVIIVTPNTDATTTQLQLLTALGADLSRVEILSYIQDPAPSSHTGGYRPFSIPEDFTHLLQAIQRLDARLVIFDPFISLLSRKSRCTDQRLCHLLADFNQHLIEHNVACLITRNCHAKGGHARPTILERSDYFETIAISRLLLSPDPLLPDRLLLSHATSRHAALTPTLTFQIQPSSSNPDLPHIIILGSHSLQAKHLINYRPNTLHRQLLSQHLQAIISEALDPVPVATLYARSPHSSPFQIQRSLNDLLNMGQIERPARGFYTLAPTSPVPSFKPTTATSPSTQPDTELKPTTATSPSTQPDNKLKSTAATSPSTQPDNKLKSTAATSLSTQPDTELRTNSCNKPEHTN